MALNSGKNRTKTTAGRLGTSEHAQDVPEVIVDFIFEDGLLFVAVENIGPKPALKVTTRFNRKFFGAGGNEDISGKAMFQNIEFLAPGKKIMTFVDTSTAYFARKEPDKISATVSWRDANGAAFKAKIDHDLAIYQDIAYIQKLQLNREKGG